MAERLPNSSLGLWKGAVKQSGHSLFSCSAIVCSLDNMLKIAHFPIIRENFQMSFAQIVAERTPQWEALEAKNYKVFDYAEFLRLRGPPAGSWVSLIFS